MKVLAYSNDFITGFKSIFQSRGGEDEYFYVFL